jgi:hypothetical protein
MTFLSEFQNYKINGEGIRLHSYSLSIYIQLCYALVLNFLYKNRSRTAPKIATKRLPMLNPSTEPNPSMEDIQPPTTAPAIPIKIVTIKPPGSLPGCNALAMAPATNPTIIHVKTPIVYYFIVLEKMKATTISIKIIPQLKVFQQQVVKHRPDLMLSWNKER